MKQYQVHPQVNGGLRTLSPVETTIGGGIEASYWTIGKVMTQEVTDHTY